MEYDDFGNDQRWDGFVDAMLASNIKPGAWFTNPSMLGETPKAARFMVAEIEDALDYQGALGWIGKVTLPTAIITTFGGLLVKDANNVTDKDATKERCKPLVDAGFFCQYEAYFYKEPDNTEPDYCGFPAERVAPVIGVGFNGRTLDQQTALQVPGYGLYLAEYLK